MTSLPVVFIQRCLPAYRVEFFTQLGRALPAPIIVIHGRSWPEEGVHDGELPFSVQVRNRRLAGVGWWQPEICNLLSRLAPRAVVCEANPRLSSAFVSARWCTRERVPLFLWGLGAVPRRRSPLEANLARHILMRLARQAEGVFAYGPGAKAYYDGLVDHGVRVWTVGNAARDTPRVISSNGAPHAPAGMSQSKPDCVSVGRRFLFVGRLVSGKGIDRLLRAAHLLSDEEVNLDIVGSGPLEQELRDLAKELGLLRVRFMGHLDGAALESAYVDADVFVLPGLGGLTIGEALGHGLPVVMGSAGDGAASEMVVDGVTGFRAESESIESLADAMARARDSADLHAMAPACRAASQAVGSLGSMVNGFAACLKPYLLATPAKD